MNKKQKITLISVIILTFVFSFAMNYKAMLGEEKRMNSHIDKIVRQTTEMAVTETINAIKNEQLRKRE